MDRGSFFCWAMGQVSVSTWRPIRNVNLYIFAVKETWEPTIEDLFKFDKGKVIREIWALDCQNHGEACVLNEDILVRNPDILSKYCRETSCRGLKVLKVFSHMGLCRCVC